MKRAVADGWHTIAGYEVYIEGGRVLRGLKDGGQLTAYPYRWDKKNGCWTNCSGLTVDAFRAGVRRESVTMS